MELMFGRKCLYNSILLYQLLGAALSYQNSMIRVLNLLMPKKMLQSVNIYFIRNIFQVAARQL